MATWSKKAVQPEALVAPRVEVGRGATMRILSTGGAVCGTLCKSDSRVVFLIPKGISLKKCATGDLCPT